MSIVQAVPKLSLQELRSEIKKESTHVALDPDKGYHFHTGRRAATLLGYDEALYADLPDSNIASFAGTGNNLTLDKTETLREWFRTFKPGGRLQVGNILDERAVPTDTIDDLSLWTG